MRLLPQSRRGTWLLAGAVWLASCAGLWWALPGQPLHEWRAGDASMPAGFLRDRRAFVTFPLEYRNGGAESRGMVRVSDFETGRVVHIGFPDEKVHAASLSPDGRLIAICRGERGTPVRLYDTDTGLSVIELPLSGPNDAVEGIAFSPDGNLVAYTERSATSDRVRIWDIRNSREVAILDSIDDLPDRALHYAGTDYLAFSPDGRLIAVADRGEKAVPVQPQVHIWDVATAKRLRTIAAPELGFWRDLRFSPDGRIIVGLFFVGQPKHTRLPWVASGWEIREGEKVLECAGDFVGLQPTGIWAVDNGYGSTPSGVRAYDFADGPPRLEFLLDKFDTPATDGFASTSGTLALLKFGKNPVADSLRDRGVPWPWGQDEEYRVRFVDAATRRTIGTLPHPAKLQDNYFGWGKISDDGRLFAMANNGVLSVWEVPPRKPLMQLIGGAAAIAIVLGLFALWRVRQRRAILHPGGMPAISRWLRPKADTTGM